LVTLQQGRRPIDLQPTPLLRLPPPPPLPAKTLGSARAIVGALLTGKLRRQFYSDIHHLGDVSDAPQRVATAYMALAAAAGWSVSTLGTLILNPTHIEAHALGVINAIGSLLGFLTLRARRDPRIMLDWLLLLTLGSIAIIALDHGGVIAPVVLSLPALAGVTALYQRPHMRPMTLVVATIVVVICVSSAMGFIGEPTTYTTRGYFFAIFVVLFGSTLALAGLAWISILARDYTLEQVRAANDAIVESAARARIALESARVGLWDVPDVNTQRFIVSDSFQAVTGYSGDEFSGIFGNLEKFVHPDDLAPLREAFAVGRERFSRIRAEFRLLTKTRGYRWFSTRARYATNPDGSMRMSGSLQDINFIKVAEEALRAGRDQARAANKAKSDFIAVMSHEVRTPLNAILGSVELLKRGPSEPEAIEMIDLIDEAGHGLLAIVNDLLDVSRIDAGKLEIAPAPTDVTSLVTRAVEFWGPQASDKGLSLTVRCEAGDNPELMLDAGRIRQIVGNLLSNAIKFTDAGEIHVHLSMQPAPGGRVQTTIGVRDSGPGVPEAEADRIFAAFEQARDDASRGGAGLGLFISRRLARMMGGDLTLEPIEGRGSHFCLTLAADRADAAGVDAGRNEAEETGWQGLHILCVDDNENNRRIAELLLGQIGFQVTLAASGAEAVDLCATRPFDLILMDIVMPDMNGMETLQQVRSEQDSLNRATPAIALTAKLSPSDLSSYLAAGFEGVSGKPIEIAALAREAARVIDMRASGAAAK